MAEYCADLMVAQKVIKYVASHGEVVNIQDANKDIRIDHQVTEYFALYNALLETFSFFSTGSFLLDITPR